MDLYLSQSCMGAWAPFPLSMDHIVWTDGSVSTVSRHVQSGLVSRHGWTWRQGPSGRLYSRFGAGLAESTIYLGWARLKRKYVAIVWDDLQLCKYWSNICHPTGGPYIWQLSTSPLYPEG